jgi:hypothetical protein
MMMTGIDLAGRAVCALPEQGFGGIYTVNMDGSCRHGNAKAGKGCACPAGYSRQVFNEYANSSCDNGRYSDGWRTTNCGVTSYVCLK